MNTADNLTTLDRLIKSLEDFAKAKKKDDEEGLGHLRDGEPMDAANKTEKAKKGTWVGNPDKGSGPAPMMMSDAPPQTGKIEILSKPPVSEAQRKAMHAAAAGKSTLDIPKSVGKEFADADEGGKLPEKKKMKKGDEPLGNTEVLEKATVGKLYHIYSKDGTCITHGQPVTEGHINRTHGGMKAVKDAGYTVKEHLEKPKDIEKCIDFFSLEDPLEKMSKPRKPTPRSAYMDEYKKPDYVEHDKKEKVNAPGYTMRYAGNKPYACVQNEEEDKAKKSEEMDKMVKPNKPTPPEAFMSDYKKPDESPPAADESKMHGLKYEGKNITKVPPKVVEPPKPKEDKPKAIPTVESHTRMQEAKIKGGKSSYSAPTALDTIKRKQTTGKGNKHMKKSEVMLKVSQEELTKSLRKSFSDAQITEMMKAAYDSGKIHHQAFLTWQNFGEVDISVLDLLDSME